MQELSAKDISSIIKSCKDSGIKSLDYGGLKLSFEGQPLDPHDDIQLDNAQGNQSHLLEKEIEEDSDLRELELQNLMISDPVAYEKHMRYEDETA
jgi:hypothetical protein